MEDAAGLAEMLNNRKILDCLRDGLPYPYTEKDAEGYITSMLAADKTKTFAFAITADDKVVDMKMYSRVKTVDTECVL